jgi:hypothetical protein
MRAAAIIAMLVLVLGCDMHPKDKFGLIPEPVPVEEPQSARSAAAISDMRAILGQQQGISDLQRAYPPLPPPEIVRQLAQGESDGDSVWNGAVVDATTLESLAQSMNKISKALPKDQGEVFDAAIKSLMFQVNIDPDIVKKASAGVPPSDTDILLAVQRLVHGKTPFDIVSDAYRINQERENRKKLPAKAIPLQPAAGTAPAAAPAKPFDDLP